MRDILNNKLNEKRSCVGGLLFLVCAMAIAGMLLFTTTISRASMIRSVAESVEHTIALECIASCYVNPVANGVSNNDVTTRTGGTDLELVAFGNGEDGIGAICPLTQFYDAMKGLHLIPEEASPNENSVSFTYTINRSTYDGYNIGQPSLSLHIGGFTAFNSW